MLIVKEGTMPQLTAVPQMLTAAAAAVLHTRQFLTNGNSNAFGGIPGTQFRATSANQQNAIREAVGEAYAMHNVATTAFVPNPLRTTLCDAKIAVGQKAGNCDQHASVAFAFLFSNDCWPVHKVHLPGHAFVVLGTAQAFAICDPWADVYCADTAVTQWLQHIWGAPVPAWGAHQVVATWASAGGSGAAFNLLTAAQNANDKMDFSE
jgi:hypothetical protein